MKNILLTLVLFAAALLPTQSFASEGSARMAHRFGIYGTYQGAPFGSLYGANIGYNIADFFRLDAGWGTYPVASIGSTSLSISALGAQAMFMIPHLNVTPVAGIGWSQITFSGSAANTTFALAGSMFYGTVGLEATLGGFFLGATYNIPVSYSGSGQFGGEIGVFF